MSHIDTSLALRRVRRDTPRWRLLVRLRLLISIREVSRLRPQPEPSWPSLAHSPVGMERRVAAECPGVYYAVVADDERRPGVFALITWGGDEERVREWADENRLAGIKAIVDVRS